MGAERQKIILVTGKGGVGKSVIAAGLAHRLSRQNKKVLLVEMGDSSFYQDFFGLREVGQSPARIETNLEVSKWSTETCLREYVLHYVKVETLYRMFFENRVMKTFIRAAPTVSEIALLGKLTSGLRHVGPPLNYDYIVVDSYATGHFLALLRAPKGLSEAVNAGPIGQQTESIYKILMDPEVCSYKIVTLPESLPTSETLELFSQLKSEFKVKPQIICNKIWQLPITKNELTSLIASEVDDGSRGFAKYLTFVHERQEKYIPQLVALDPNMQKIPLITDSKSPLDLISKIGSELSV
jgi:hypothetical protein